MLLLIITYFTLVLCALKLFSLLTTGICTSDICLLGKTALVTGGTSGIGLKTARNLASRGCKVIIADVVNGEEVVKMIINKSSNKNVIYKFVDLSSLASVRKFAQQIMESETNIDILINNAGCGGFDGIYTQDGLLKVIQVNHFGPFLLTHLLIDLLKKSSNGRIVFVSSLVAFTHSLSSPKQINEVSGSMFSSIIEYSNSKLCGLVAAKLFAHKLKKYGISCYSVHPGMVKTNIIRKSYNNIPNKYLVCRILHNLIQIIYKIYGKTIHEGSQTTLYCAIDNYARNFSGRFFIDCVPFIEPSAAKSTKFNKELWKLSEKLVKLESHEMI